MSDVARPGEVLPAITSPRRQLHVGSARLSASNAGAADLTVTVAGPVVLGHDPSEQVTVRHASGRRAVLELRLTAFRDVAASAHAENPGELAGVRRRVRLVRCHAPRSCFQDAAGSRGP